MMLWEGKDNADVTPDALLIATAIIHIMANFFDIFFPTVQQQNAFLLLSMLFPCMPSIVRWFVSARSGSREAALIQ